MVKSTEHHISIVVPTYNGGALWERCAEAIHQYAPPDTTVMVMDSGSKDTTLQTAQRYGFSVVDVLPNTFNHGSTRAHVLQYLPDSDIVVYMTQDAVLKNDQSIRKLVAAFDDPSVGLAYGRQLPHADANPIATHARQFNYHSVSIVKEKRNIQNLGLKAAFASDSFAAYRVSALKDVGNFPETICSEDMLVGINLLQADYKIAYVADAEAYHSHNYSVMQEFRRYFDIGVSHYDYRQRLEVMGRAEGEGLRFVRSEFQYLLKNHAVRWIPLAVLHSIAKYAGYKTGFAYKRIPRSIRPEFSMYRGYWTTPSGITK